MKKRILVLFGITFSFLYGYSQTQISGNVSGTWEKKNSPFFINGNIKIQKDDSLIIEPGVKVVFQGFYKIEILGQILAFGNSNDSIVFTVNDTTGFNNPNFAYGAWGGIDFMQETDKNNMFYHCVFEFAKDGAIRLKTLNGNLDILNSVFRNNGNLGYSGGALYYDGSNNQGLLTIRNCDFINNYAVSGGALNIWSYNSKLKELSNCRFINNHAIYFGGAVCIQGTSIFNCLFKNNYSLKGGAVWTGGSSSLKIYNSIFDSNDADQGGAFYANHGAVSAGLFNCTIINNKSASSSVYLGENYVLDFTISNSVLWNPDTYELYIDEAVQNNTIENSIIRNGTNNPWFTPTCKDLDPKLATDGVNIYSPLAESPCIDGGSNSFTKPTIKVDFNNHVRTWDGDNNGDKLVDIGAIEYNAVDSFPKIAPNLLSDTVCENSEKVFELTPSSFNINNKFEWYYNNNIINNNSSTLNLKPININSSGYYFGRISNEYGVTQSDIAILKINTSPTKPSVPIGDISVNEQNSVSDYYIQPITSNQNITWELLPNESGSITYNDFTATVNWSNSYIGKASLMVIHSNEECSSTSDTLKISVRDFSNSIDQLNDQKVVIYPNPSNGNVFINLEWGDEFPVTLSIYDVLGKIVTKRVFSTHQFTLDEKLPKGLFFFKFESNKSKIIRKILIE